MQLVNSPLGDRIHTGELPNFPWNFGASVKLSDLKQSLTLDHEVEHPVSGPTGWVITLAADGHPATKAALRKLLDKRAKRKVLNVEADERDGIALLVARTLGWTGLDLEFSAQAAEQVYTDEMLIWVKRQVLTALGDDAGFFVK